MTKIRVHELAREFGMASKEMVAKIKDLGYNIKNYMSTLDEYEVQEIRRRLRGEADAQREKTMPKTTIRRKHHVVRLKKIVRKPVEETPEPVAKEEEVPQESMETAGKIASEPKKIVIKKKELKTEKVTVEKAAADESKEKAPVAEPEVLPPREEPKQEEPKKEEAKEPDKKAVEPPKKTVEVQPVQDASKEKKKEEPPKAQPKSFVKIIDRRIDIVKPTPKPEKKSAPPSAKKLRPVSPPVGKTPKGATPEPAAPVGAPSKGPEKKSKKKAKRVVDITAMEKPKRRAAPKRKGKQKPITKLLVEEVDLDVPESMEITPPIGGAKKAQKHEQKPKPGTAPIKAEKRKFSIYETIQVGELAKRMSVKVADVIKKLMEQGVMATANQSLDYDTAAIIASEFGYEVERKAVAEDLVHIDTAKGGEPVPRPPVVTVMGHVDHGKTTLLDAIRHADVASKEAGGITQHIGAYHVKLSSGNDVVFLDTPGHEAFTAMRARGAKVTDIVILVVAADDGVMAQTREAIDHSRAAGVPIIVAVNKIDKPGANPDRVKSELAELGLVPEDWGGDTIFVNVSAKQKTGIDKLLELLALQAELMELKADPECPARGHVVEARLDKGRGPVATFLIREGTLHVGDAVVCDIQYGKIRAMLNDKGNRIKSAGPSMPVEVQGLSGVPEAGTEFVVLPDEKKAREVAEYRQRKAREAELVRNSRMSLEGMLERLQEKESKELNIVLKTDVQGSLEAMSEALHKLSTPDIKINIVRRGIGAITESDVLLASASDAIIIGFNVKPAPQAKSLAESEKVEIRFYDVIYHALEEIKSAMVGMLEPVYEEQTLGRAEVRETFHIPKMGTVAGCYVVEGVMQRNALARLLRDNVVIYTGKIASLRRFKDDVKEVQTGYECGIGLEKFNDIKVGDVIEAYEMKEVAPELTTSFDQKNEEHKGS